jgi:hypothetical protein
VRVPLYGTQTAEVTGREAQKRPSGAAFDGPVREGREVRIESQADEIRRRGGAQMGRGSQINIEHSSY